jgi:hypothetical protein
MCVLSARSAVSEEEIVGVEYVIRFPDYFDEYAGEIEAKGYFADLEIDVGGLKYKPPLYDTVRVRQECEDHLTGGGAAFAERNLVVLSKITREQIGAGIAELARTEFHALSPEPR